MTEAERQENLRQIEANMAIEGIQLHPDDRALILRGIEEGWSKEKMDAAIMSQLVESGVIGPDAMEVSSTAAE